MFPTSTQKQEEEEKQTGVQFQINETHQWKQPLMPTESLEDKPLLTVWQPLDKLGQEKEFTALS